MGPPVELINVWNPGDWRDWIGPVLAAPFIGSFLGVLILRLPAGEEVVASRSACPHCGHKLGPLELVPLLSFAALRGRCLACRKPIALFHPAVELAALAVAIWAATQAGGALIWASCILGWTLLALAWIDVESLRLPNALTLPLIPAGLAEAWLLEPEALRDRLLGAAIGYTAFRLVAIAYLRLRGRAGLGEGDAKLLAASGAWVGAGLLAPVILVAAVAGLLWALARRLRGETLHGGSKLAFGPCLALATWLVWLYSA